MDMDTGLDIIIAPNIEPEQNLSSEHWEQHQHRVSCSAGLPKLCSICIQLLRPLKLDKLESKQRSKSDLVLCLRRWNLETNENHMFHSTAMDCYCIAVVLDLRSYTSTSHI